MTARDDFYKPGDPEPRGYVQWHAWADVQRRAKARKCSRAKGGK